jgi:hypothetical protein
MHFVGWQNIVLKDTSCPNARKRPFPDTPLGLRAFHSFPVEERYHSDNPCSRTDCVQLHGLSEEKLPCLGTVRPGLRTDCRPRRAQGHVHDSGRLLGMDWPGVKLAAKGAQRLCRWGLGISVDCGVIRAYNMA